MADLTLFFTLALFLPLYTLAEMRWVRRRLRAGDTRARLWLYRSTLLAEWGLAASVLALWWIAGRDWTLLGFGGPTSATLPGLGEVPAWRFWLALGLAALASLALVAQAVGIARAPEKRAQVRESMRALNYLVPRRPAERRLFGAVAVTAGITEEILYRGFLLWLLAPHLGVVGGAALAVVLFGLLHSYQGGVGVLRTTLAGTLLMAFYLLGGALWAPILLHATIDLVSGRLGSAVLADDDAGAGAPEPAVL
ncbi:MAG: CPBP family intramembrane glutamic endopeptidase [Acidobacteriota bacterium]